MEQADVRRRTEENGGAFQRPGPVKRPQAHDLFKMEDIGGSIRIHVELPPVDVQEVVVDITGSTIDIILPQGRSDEVYCSIDIPYGVDRSNVQRTVSRGHLEIVMPKVAR